MRKINYKILFITCIMCLLPMLLGISVYNKLPDKVAIHFDINNQPDNYASKNLAVFGFPILMLLLQIFCCVVSDIKMEDKNDSPKLVIISKWIIPVLTIVVYTLIMLYPLGTKLDVANIACILIGIIIILIGNYLPKIRANQAIVNPKFLVKNEKVWRKISRIMGNGLVTMGFLFIISIFMPPIASVICVFLIIIFSIITFIYSIYLANKL